MLHSSKPIWAKASGVLLAAGLMTVSACAPAEPPPLFLAVPATHAGDMALSRTKPWVEIGPEYAAKGPHKHWTLDGVWLNSLLIYGGLADGQPTVVMEGEAAQHPSPRFSATMDALALPELVAGTISVGLASGVAVETTSVRPAEFVGHPAFESEYRYLTGDGLEMAAYATGANVGGRLYLILFVAPSMHYYGKDLAEVRQIASSARRS